VSSVGAQTKRRCAVCHASYGRGERFCPLDGGAIIEEGGDDPLIGSTLDERYLIRRFIGRGGMGSVYEADHVGLDKRIAIKLIADADADRDARARFRQEARAASKIHHPNVVQISDVGVDGQGRDYLAMEYVEGDDLRKLVDAGPVEPARAVAITAQVLAGLGAIHAAGLVHRDIKPANILLAGDQVKIMDFGIAKSVRTELAQTDTGTGRVVGTPQFMAPEQLADLDVDHRADLYAVGVTLFVLLSGKLPFDGTSFTNAAAAIEQPAPALTTLRADLPPELVAVVARALAKRPSERFADAAQFAAALGAPTVPVSRPPVDGATVPQKRSASRELEPRRDEATVRAPGLARGRVGRGRLYVGAALVAAVVAVVVVMLVPSRARPPAKQPSALVPGDAAVATPALDRLKIARDAEARGELALAITAYQEEYAAHPTPDVAYRLGDLYERIGDRERAVGSLQRYLDTATNAPDRAAVTERIARLSIQPKTDEPTKAVTPPIATKQPTKPATPATGKDCACEIRSEGGWKSSACSAIAKKPSCTCNSTQTGHEQLCPLPWTLEDMNTGERLGSDQRSGIRYCLDPKRVECMGVDKPAICGLLVRQNAKSGEKCSGYDSWGNKTDGEIECDWCVRGPGWRGEPGDACSGFEYWSGKPAKGTLVGCTTPR